MYTTCWMSILLSRFSVFICTHFVWYFNSRRVVSVGYETDGSVSTVPADSLYALCYIR